MANQDTQQRSVSLQVRDGNYTVQELRFLLNKIHMLYQNMLDCEATHLMIQLVAPKYPFTNQVHLLEKQAFRENQECPTVCNLPAPGPWQEIGVLKTYVPSVPSSWNSRLCPHCCVRVPVVTTGTGQEACEENNDIVWSWTHELPYVIQRHSARDNAEQLPVSSNIQR